MSDQAEVEAAVDRARRTVPFYGEHLRRHAGRDLRDLPTFTKAHLEGWGPFPLQAGALDGVARFAATSGTTGRRMLVGYSEADWDTIGSQLAHRASTAGIGKGDLLANTHGYGLWIGGPALDLLAQRSGAALFPCGPGGAQQLAQWLSEIPITAISATPSYLRLLAELLSTADVDRSGWQLQVGLIGGEPASAALRRQVVESLGTGFRWQELYGSTEVGGPVVGWSPPDEPWSETLLIDDDEFVIELLHPDRDEAVEHGELGELTVTTLRREASPLIRYRTRDLAAAVARPDGRTCITAIVARIDDALKVRGALVYPGAIERIVVASCPLGTEWRVELGRDPGRLDVLTIVVEHDEADAGGLAGVASEAIGVRCDLRVVPVGSLERFEGKARRVVDRR